MLKRVVVAALFIAADGGAHALAGDEVPYWNDPINGCDRMTVQPGQDPSDLPDIRKGCLQGEAYMLLGNYFWSARERVFAGFGDKDLELRIAATHVQDVPKRGPASREYLLRIYEYINSGSAHEKTVGVVARLRRVKGDAVSFQVEDYLEAKYGFQAKIAKLMHLKQPEFLAAAKAALPPIKEVVDAIAVEEFVTDKAACPALAARMEALFDMEIPRPSSIRRSVPGDTTVERIVIHPTIIEVRIADYPISLTVRDNGMHSAPYRWVTETMTALEPCWRHTQKP